MAISNNSTGLRPGVCTSSTRPAAPYEGQMIYETDTDKVLVWNGSAWYPNWNTAWGTVAYQTATSNSSVFTGETVMLTTSSFTAVSGRRYRITYFEPTISTFSTTVNFVRSALRLTNISGTRLQFADYAIINQRSAVVLSFVTSSLSGSTTICSTNEASGGGSLICARASDSISHILVEDIGPA